MTENEPPQGKIEPQNTPDILARLQAVRDDVAKDPHSVNDYDRWIAEPSEEFLVKHGRIIPQSDEEIDDLTRSVRAENMRTRRVLARLFQHDVLPLDVLPRETREAYQQRIAEGAPASPYSIESPTITYIGESNFEERVRVGNIKLFAYRTEETTGQGYLEACDLDTYAAQLNEAAAYDHVKDQEADRKAIEFMRKLKDGEEK